MSNQVDSEVEIVALPGNWSLNLEVARDGADDGEADFTVVGKLLVGAGFPASGGADRPCVFANDGGQEWVGGVVGKEQVTAEDVDALLPVLLPGVGEGSHGVDAGQSFCGGCCSELSGGCSEPLVKPRGLQVPLTAVGNDYKYRRLGEPQC